MNLSNYEAWSKGGYSEISQTNPIRWMNLKKDVDAYTCVSYWWKCKDFMNEVVVSYNNSKTYSIYGFTVNSEKFFNREDTSFSLLLKGILPGWLKNMEVVNTYLKAQGMPPVGIDKAEEFDVVHLPLKYLENTLYMSQVTLFIRLANTTNEYNTLDEMVLDPLNTGDKLNYQACLSKPMGKLPKDLQKYLWYYDQIRSLSKDLKKQPETVMTSLMHNCGVVGWNNGKGWV